MMDNNIGDQFKSHTSPEYGLFSRETIISIGIAAILIVITIASMWGLRETAAADFAVWAYRDAIFAPFMGLIIFSIPLTAGYYFGLKGAADENYLLAFGATLLLTVTYGTFGAGILSLFSSSIHMPAILVTAGITTSLTIVSAAVIYTTGHDFSRWEFYAGFLMIGGAIVYLIYTVISVSIIGWIAFGLILLGWVCDLVYEIYAVSNHRRSPVVNGIGVYIAFMGVFVHLLQLVLQAMAEE